MAGGTTSEAIGLAHRCLTGNDVEVVLDAAAATIGTRRVTSELHRLHHRPGRSVTRVERALLTRVGRAAAAPGPNVTTPDLLVAHAHHRPVPGPVHRVEVAGTTLAVWAYPNDPYLPGLRLASDHDWAATHLRQAGQPVDGLTLHRRAYRPTRGAVVEARVPGASGSRVVAFLKVLSPGRIDQVVQVHTDLDGSLPVPAVLAHRDDVAVLAAMSGTPVRRALRRGQPLPHPDDLVDLSVRLAATNADTGQDPRRRVDPGASASRLRDEVPDLAPSIDAIAEVASQERSGLVTVHGDLHGGQILSTDSRVTGLLDLDGVGRGHLADDAATLVTYLAAQGDHHPGARRRATRYADAVLAAYRDVVDPGALPPAIARAWLSLATVAHRAGDEPLLRARVDRAERALHGGTPPGVRSDQR